MICDAETLELTQGIERILAPPGAPGMVKPELMQSVLEIATEPCGSVGEAGGQLAHLRRVVREVAGGLGMAIGPPALTPRASTKTS